MAKYSSLQQVQSSIKAGEITCQSLVQYYLEQIDATKNLNAYIEVFGEEALQRAADLDEKYNMNPDSVGRLYGMVVSLKDVICYKDHKVTAASKILENFTSLYSATAVERILAEDAIIIGRVNCDQFGMGSASENTHYGASKNPIDTSKIPGGSSGGSAASVKADTCLASLGTDTGGSVRQPAAFCGLVGLKPTYGRISRHGLLAYGSSFDQIGVLANGVEDAAILLEIMAGADGYDGTASTKVVDKYSSSLDFEGTAQVAYIENAILHEGLNAEIKNCILQFIESLKEKGHQTQATDFDYLDYMVPAYYVLTTAEASTNLSRYDGVRYGHRNEEAESLEEIYRLSRTEGFHKEVKRRIMLGTFVLSSGYYDAYYTKAQKVRRLIQERTLEILDQQEFIIMPVSPVSPWESGSQMDDPVANYLADIYTVQANMSGIPAISIPIATHSDGMPISVQIMTKPFNEARLMAFAQNVITVLSF